MGYTKPIDPSTVWQYIDKTIEQGHGSVDATSSTTVQITATKKTLIFLYIRFTATSSDSYIKITKQINLAYRRIKHTYADGTHEIYVDIIDLIDQNSTISIEFYNAHTSSKSYQYTLGRVALE